MLLTWWMSASLAGTLVSDDALAHQARRLAGAFDTASVIGVWKGGEREVWAAGVRGPEGSAVLPDDLFEIGSVTKTFTATLLADAVVRGEVALDDRVVSLLPPGAAFSHGEAITLAQLASHRSGLGRMPCTLIAGALDPYPSWGVSDLWSALGSCGVSTPPGQTYAYSNYGMGLLGALLAERQQTTWIDLLRARVLEPLELRDTGYPEVDPTRLVQGSRDGEYVPHWHFGALAGAGALRSNAHDLLRWGAMNAALMDAGALTEAVALSHHTWWETPAPAVKVALGWHATDTGRGRALWHNGMTGGFAAFVGSLGDTVVVVLAASSRSVDGIGMHLLVPELPLEELPPRESLPDAMLAEYAGSYRIGPREALQVIPRPGHLVVRFPDVPAVAIWPAGDDRFTLEVIGAAILFRRDGQGRVNGLWLERDGRQWMPRRVSERALR